MTVCLTGYRPLKLPWKYNEFSPEALAFKETVSKEIVSLFEKGFDTFICGMAQGFDLICGRIIISLNKINRTKISLVCMIPFAGQQEKWSQSVKEEYQDILNNCASSRVCSTSYTPSCMQQRNKEMVDSCDIVLACFDGIPGGTANTIKYAIKKGKLIECINPTTNTISMLNNATQISFF